MKTFFLFLVLTALWVDGVHAQQQEQLFAMIYSKGPAWNDSLDFMGQAYAKAHSMHLQQLRKENRIPLGGRYSDYGFMILKAENLEEAEAITSRDSSVLHGTFRVELHAFNLFYTGCIEKTP